jgi:hypothetical protein
VGPKRWPKPEGGHPCGRLLSHLSLAIIGLALWVGYLATDSWAIAWIAVAILVAVALLGNRCA